MCRYMFSLKKMYRRCTKEKGENNVLAHRGKIFDIINDDEMKFFLSVYTLLLL